MDAGMNHWHDGSTGGAAPSGYRKVVKFARARV